MRMPTGQFRALGCGLLTVLGCSREPGIDVREVYPPPRLALALPQESGRLRYEATSEGFARISLAHAGRRAAGEVPVASGWLRVAADDVRSLSGELEFALPRFLLLDPSEGLDRHRVERLLELGDSPLHDRASFRVLSVDAAGEPRAERANSPGEDEREVRVVELSARGLLELHGFRAVREVTLELTFEYGPGPGLPESVTVTSKRPLHLGSRSFGLGTDPGEKALGKLLDSAAVSIQARFLPSGE
jgi:hypothetical protein